MVIVKRRTSSAYAWAIAHDGAAFAWASDYYQFDTSAKRTDGASTVFRIAPTTTTFGIGTSISTNLDTYVAYCFAEIPGFSKFGSYTGNGNADGPFVYLGFRPRYVMIKKSSGTGGSWVVLDSSRDTYNPETSGLFTDSNSAESAGYFTDFTSNGFKLRVAAINVTSDTYIYAAFAEMPFQFANAR
jgi:hypothetical protein